MDLSVKIGNATFPNPIWTASGTFGYGMEFAHRIDITRLGAICTKGISLNPREGNPPPRIWETAAGMLNSIGLENVGVEAFIKEKMPPLREIGATVIANIYGSAEEDYVALAQRLDGVEGVSALELNLSCPNVKKGGMAFGVDPELAGSVTEKVKKATQLPILVKLSPNCTDPVAVAVAVEAAGADGISAINTLLGMSIDVRTGRHRIGAKTAGLSGPAIKPVAIRIVYQTARAVKIPVIGIGGIMNVSDVLEFFRAGAVAVQIGTANFVHHTTGMRILDQLPDAMRALGAERPEDLRIE